MSTRTTDGPQRLTTPEALRRWSLRCHAAGMSVGLVPTMGALHAGHLSLVRRALHECDRVGVSIFVNPRQFAPGEDYARYPRSLESDLALLHDAGVHAVFTPDAGAMYPESSMTEVRVGGPLGESLEAAHRPGHLEGVALVVTKLLVAGRPDRAYFGRKDAQQCALVARLAQDLDTGVQVVPCAVVRDDDGLALSSRNAYLEGADRARARSIPWGLAEAARLFAAGERDPEQLLRPLRDALLQAAAAVDYAVVVDPDTFSPSARAAIGCLVLVAAKIGGTRLIDAMRLGLDDIPAAAGWAEQTCSVFS